MLSPRLVRASKESRLGERPHTSFRDKRGEADMPLCVRSQLPIGYWRQKSRGVVV